MRSIGVRRTSSGRGCLLNQQFVYVGVQGLTHGVCTEAIFDSRITRGLGTEEFHHTCFATDTCKLESIISMFVHLGYVTLSLVDQILNQFEGLFLRSGGRHTDTVKWCPILSICYFGVTFFGGYEILSNILITVGASIMQRCTPVFITHQWVASSLTNHKLDNVEVTVLSSVVERSAFILITNLSIGFVFIQQEVCDLQISVLASIV